jgi:hypothetical protein
VEVQVRDPPSDPNATPQLQYDPEWLAILRATCPYLTFDYAQPKLPPYESMYR